MNQDISNSNIIVPDAYCSAGATSTSFEKINNVQLGTINNSSSATAGYEDFTGISTTVTQGDAVSFSVSYTPSYTADRVLIWIDYNQNEDFTDAGELVAQSTTSAGGGYTYSGSFNIPAAAPTGATRIRIRLHDSSIGANSAPCGTSTYGQVEDYTINILPNLNCAGTPDPGNTLSSVAQACSGVNFGLSLQNPQGTGTTYQWQYGPSSTGPWTNFGGSTATINTSQTVATYYQCVVTCTFSGLSATSAPVFVDMNPFLNCYCTASGNSTFFEDIGRVQFGSIDNSSTGTAGYENFTSISTDALQGTYMPITITVGVDPYPNDQAIAWIDYNQNGSFSDPGEQIFISPLGAGPHSGVVFIPEDAVPGTTHMRVRVHDAAFGPNSTPCGTSSYGQVEDYSINIVFNPPCSGTPDPGASQASAPTVCNGNTVDLSLENPVTGTGITYQWQSAASSTGPWTDIPGAIYVPYSVTVTDTTWYQCVVTCTNSSMTVISTPVKVGLNPFLQCYCTPPVEDCTDDDVITRVTISTLDNVSACSPNGYGDYKSTLPVTTLYSGTLNPISVETPGIWPDGVAGWIDYNHNGIYEASEATRIGDNLADPVVRGAFNIPAGTQTGVTGMRIRLAFGFYPDGFSPCEDITGFGETEEYLVNIQPCVPVVITGHPSNASAVCGNSATFSAMAEGSYPSYQWQTRTDPTIPHTVTFTNNTPLAVPDGDPAGVYSTITVSGLPADAVISDVSIMVNIDHTYVGDMENNIIAPNGVSLNLMGELDNGTGSNSSDNFTNTIVSSTGTVPLSGAPAPRTGTFRADRLSGYGPSGNYQTSANGMPWSDLFTDLNGDWRLGLSDWYNGDVGTLNNWSITFTYTSSTPWVNIVDGGVYSGATTSTLTVNPVTQDYDGNEYRVIVTGVCSAEDFSNTATLTVTPMIPVVDPSSATICNGDIQSLSLTNFTNVVTLIDEGFEDFGTSVPAGWVVKNNSTVPTVGLEGWDPATPTYTGIPPANTGSNYAASSFFGDNGGGGGGTMSMWLFTPQMTINNGDVLKFYALALGDPTFPDRLQVRMSSNGASTDVGATPLSTGDFSTVLLDINPTYQGGVFLNAWVEYTVTVSGLSGPVDGRIAFRHFIEDDDINGYFVGLDDVRYIAAPTVAQGTWTGPAGTMWTDAAATVAYTGTPATTIYVN
ncbi:MAG: choice-of-anchor J domain-containing protein, partial [Chitinophagales bacterium]|nr:choice-of-anchor J domain-containing protein [Chitinophagales bacterium]